MADATIKVTQYRSAIGSKPKQRGTLRALGLGKIGRSHTLPDRPEIRGMLARVPHLVKVEDVVAEKPAKKAPAKKAPAKKATAEKAAADEAPAKEEDDES
jgi:large subunit ribosomal protein L30